MNNEQTQRVNRKEQIAKLRYYPLPLLPATCYLLFVILLFSCDKNTRDFSPSAVIEVEQSDKELERIADNAQRALPTFFRNLTRPEAGADNFYVKYPLTDDDGNIEQVWLGNVHLNGGIYFGRLANTTKRLESRKGGSIIIDTDKITDWMYIQDGKIIGGRSIKYLLEKIPETQRSEGQKKILLMFE
jgi:uncharacterized protein YegJ (DUF2314 family)